MILPLFPTPKTMNEVCTIEPKQALSPVVATINEVPEELLWRANFNSKNAVPTYDHAIRSFVEFLSIASPEELQNLTHPM